MLLTDSLPTGVTYIASTFDTEPAVVGSTRQWSLGTLAPGTQKHVFVVLQNALEPGQSFQNVVDISTTSQGDDTGNNHRVSDPVQVTSNLSDVNVGQWVNPGDVLAGDSYRVVVNYGNNGPVPAGPVHLTVQLDPTVALVDWVSENGYRGLWKMTQGAAGAFLFEAPALPGFWGDKLLLRVNVPSSMPADKELVSTVSIGAPLDPNPGNDGPFSQSARVTQSQRPDLHVDKRWGYGQLVKGGRAFYQLNYSNDGNLTQQHVLLSDTLPAGTTFVAATVDSNWGQSTSRPPLSNVDGKATWDLDTLAPGEWGNLKVEVALDHVEPGSTITNKADITGPDNDRSWWNNHSTVVEQVNAAGPNLRVRSESSWESREEVRFEIYFENLGTTTIEDVQITDTLPEGLEFGNWGTNFWQPMNGGNYDPATRKITWTIDRLEPGWTSSINVRARVPVADHDKQGLIFENTAQITAPPGEVTSNDNRTTTAAFTGPDLFIEKSLWSGKVAAGELVTFAITIGNRNNGPWNTGDHPQDSPGIKIVDTLPAGMTFVRAYAGPDEWKPDQQVGNVVTWYAYGICAGCRWQFLVEARIAATLPGGSPLTNTAEITDLVAGDVDPFSANNQSSWQGTVDKRRTYLPVLMR